MPRFEYIGGGSEKFWDIERAGASVTVSFGRLGTAGQAQVKDLGTDQAASAHVAKLIAEKVKKGYVESGSVPAPAPAPPAVKAAAATAPVTDEPDEDTWKVPPTWWRHTVPIRGRGPARSPKGGADAGRLAALREETAEARARVLDHPESDPDLVRHARRHLDGTQSSPLGAAVTVALVVGSTARSGGAWLPAVADEWVAAHGISFAAEAGALLSGICVANPKRHYGAHPDNVVRAATAHDFWISNVQPLGARLRGLLATADDSDYADAVARLAAHRSGSPPVRISTSYLAPTEQKWVDQDVRSAGVSGPMLVMLLASVTTVPQAIAALKRSRGWWGGQPELIYSISAHIGPEVAPILADHFDASSGDVKKRAAAMLAEIPTDQAFRLLLDRTDEKYVRPVLMDAMVRFPRRALRILAEEAREGPQAATALALLRDHAVSHPDLVESSPAAQELLHTAEVTSTGWPTASDDQLPPVLVSPPWGPGQVRPAPVVVTGIDRMSPIELIWEPGEQEVWAAADAGFSWLPPRIGDWEAAVQDAVARRDYYLAGYLALAPAEIVRPHLAHVGLWYGDDTAAALRIILGRFGEAAAELVVRAVLAAPSSVGDVLLPLAGTEIAIRMAERYAIKADRPVVLAWLDRHPAAAARDLVPPALGKPGKRRAHAEAALRVLDQRGHGDAIRAAAAPCGPAAADGIEALLTVDPLQLLPARIPPLPAWLDPAFLPPVLLADRTAALPAPAIGHICTMLAMSEPGGVYPGIDVARAVVDGDSLADLAWAMFERWGAAGHPSSETWILHGLGLFGDDETVRRLTPLIQAWPGQSAHARAVAGLQVLASIGSDTALIHLHAIAERAKFNGLKTAALAKMEEVAAGLGLTAEQLADRLVPGFGLDSEGSLVLDYGGRRFRVGFDEQLKPFVVDPDGSSRKALPKPGAKDDPVLAPAAYARFTSLKKDVRTVATDEIRRLERAMVTSRRWTAVEQRALFIQHPLLRHLARRLVWATFDDDGDPSGFFRIAEDQTLAGPTDDALTLAAADVVGIAHPLHLGKTLGVWSDVFADYEILQPFPQLGREVFHMTADERRSRVLRRFTGLKVPTGTVLGLSHRGWVRGSPQDHGASFVTYKLLPGGQAVIVDLNPGIIAGETATFPEQTVEGVWLNDGPAVYDNPNGNLVFGELDDITASEVLRDLEGLRA